jgi:hypothetical protein
MKSTSRLLGCFAIVSALGIAPSAFAAKGGGPTIVSHPTTTATFQPAQDPLGPHPSATGIRPSVTGGNGHIFRVIPPPPRADAGPSSTTPARSSAMGLPRSAPAPQ